MLAQHSGDGVDGAAYTDLTAGESLDPSLFTWDGPVVTDQESRARAGGDGPSATRWEEAMRWFRDTVTAEPIQVPVLMDLSPASGRSDRPPLRCLGSGALVDASDLRELAESSARPLSRRVQPDQSSSLYAIRGPPIPVRRGLLQARGSSGGRLPTCRPRALRAQDPVTACVVSGPT